MENTSDVTSSLKDHFEKAAQGSDIEYKLEELVMEQVAANEDEIVTKTATRLLQELLVPENIFQVQAEQAEAAAAVKLGDLCRQGTSTVETFVKGKY